MVPIPVQYEELLAIMQTCAKVNLEQHANRYLQDYIAASLDRNRPSISAAVRGLDPAQMAEVCALIRHAQELTTPPAPVG